jgi:putative transposase
LTSKAKRGLIEPENGHVSVKRQCELLGLARSSYYYEEQEEDENELLLMRLLDEQYMRTPFYGSRRMRDWLEDEGHTVCRERVQGLMRRMGVAAIYPKPRLSQGMAGHAKYPYLLKGLKIERADQVWATDITFIRLRRGFAYLTAIMDWFSRYVIEW